MWSSIPLAEQDKAMVAYGREGPAGLQAALSPPEGGPEETVLNARIGVCLLDYAEVPGLEEAVFTAYIGYGLEEAAINALREKTGKPRTAFLQMWPSLTAQQREFFRDLMKQTGGDLQGQDAATLTRMTSAASAGAEAADIPLIENLADVIAVFLGRAMRESVESHL